MSDESRGELTPRQEQVLDMIRASIDRDGYPPTIREIGVQLGIRSTNGVNDHLKALERKGYLTRGDAKSRALVPVDVDGEASEADSVEVPLVGRIAAGEPIAAVEQAEDTVRVDRFFIGPHREVFALRVVGDSMIGDGIHDGDYIFVRNQAHANPGDIVVAWIEGATEDGDATVKRYFPEGDRIRFEPSNPAMDPIYVDRADMRDVRILGIVVGLYRRVN